MMKLLSVHFPEALIEALDMLVYYKVFANRSEAIRIAVRDLIKSELKNLMQLRPITEEQDTPFITEILSK